MTNVIPNPRLSLSLSVCLSLRGMAYCMGIYMINRFVKKAIHFYQTSKPAKKGACVLHSSDGYPRLSHIHPPPPPPSPEKLPARFSRLCEDKSNNQRNCERDFPVGVKRYIHKQNVNAETDQRP